MSRFVFVLAISMLTAACKLKDLGALASLVAFEGRIEMSIDMPMMPSAALATSFEIKGKKIRSETKGIASMVSIADMDVKKSWLIDNGAHTYMEMDLAKSSSSTSSPTSKSTAKALKLGTSGTVAGYACELWEVTDVGTRTELCIASGLSMMALGLSGPLGMYAKGDDAWSEVLSHGFPLRMVMSDASGKPSMKMEATRIEKKSIPDSQFVIPAGYTRTPSPI
jgi:hypothetical protein